MSNEANQNAENAEKKENYESIPVDDNQDNPKGTEVNKHQNDFSKNIKDLTAPTVSQYLSTISGIIWTLVWYILFHSHTTYPEHIGDPTKCIDLLSCGKNLTVFYYYLLIAYSGVLFLIFCQSACCMGNEVVLGFRVFLNSVASIAGLVFWIIYFFTTSSALREKEECGDLRSLASSWWYINFILLCIAGASCICGVCCAVIMK